LKDIAAFIFRVALRKRA